MIAVLSTPTQTILNEVNVLRLTQRQVAKTYALAILDQANVDWTLVNRAIMDRWSRSGLNNVKHMAWKILEAPGMAREGE